MLDRRSADQAARQLRRHLRDNPEPAPQIVLLLGRVGDNSDWRRITQWLDSPRVEIKTAAAQAWADSPDRPLSALADRLDDPAIAPIVYTAAARRGDDGQTMKALATRRPERQGARDAWRRALVAMAARVPAEDVLEVVGILTDLEEPPDHIEAVVSAAFERTGSPALTDKQRVALSIERGRIRLARADYANALIDFAFASANPDELSPRQIDQVLRGEIEAHLQLEQDDAAVSAVTQLIPVASGGDTHLSSDHPAIDLFIDAARRRHDDGENEEALVLLAKLRQLMGPSMKGEVAQEINLLEATINGERAGGGQPGAPGS
jgi:hypothetical protein